MKIKNLIISVAVLALIAVIAYKQSEKSISPATEHPKVNKPILSSQEILNTQSFVISSPEWEDNESITLLKKDERWILPEYFNIPVKFEKLQKLSKQLQNTKIQRFVTNTPERLERLKLGKTVLQLQDSSGKEIQKVIFGKRSSSSGNFLQYEGSTDAFLSENKIRIASNFDNWAETRVLKIKKNDVKSLSIEIRDKMYTLSRPDKDTPYSSDDVDSERTINQDAIRQIIERYSESGFREPKPISDEKAQAAKQHSRTLKIQLFDETEYTLRIGRRPASEETVTGEDAEGKKVERIKKTPPGPTYITVESNQKDFYWAEIQKNAALQYPDYTLTYLPESVENLLEEVDFSEQAESTLEGIEALSDPPEIVDSPIGPELPEK